MPLRHLEQSSYYLETRDTREKASERQQEKDKWWVGYKVELDESPHLHSGGPWLALLPCRSHVGGSLSLTRAGVRACEPPEQRGARRNNSMPGVAVCPDTWEEDALARARACRVSSAPISQLGGNWQPG